jgi:hypothetical protein
VRRRARLRGDVLDQHLDLLDVAGAVGLGKLPELDVGVLRDPHARDRRQPALTVQRPARLGVGGNLQAGGEALRKSDVLRVDQHVREQLVDGVLKRDDDVEVADAHPEDRRVVQHRDGGHDADDVGRHGAVGLPCLLAGAAHEAIERVGGVEHAAARPAVVVHPALERSQAPASVVGRRPRDHLQRRLDRDPRRVGIVGVGQHEHVGQAAHARLGVGQRRVGVEVVGLPEVPGLVVGALVGRTEAEPVDLQALDGGVHDELAPVVRELGEQHPERLAPLARRERQALVAHVVSGVTREVVRAHLQRGVERACEVGRRRHQKLITRWCLRSSSPPATQSQRAS